MGPLMIVIVVEEEEDKDEEDGKEENQEEEEEEEEEKVEVEVVDGVNEEDGIKKNHRQFAIIVGSLQISFDNYAFTFLCPYFIEAYS